MPTVLKKIEDFAANIAPEWTNVHAVTRAVPRFPDSNLRGSLRYARRLGNFIPNIQPQNQVTLTEPAYSLQNVIEVDSVLPGFVPGALINIGEQELVQILDVDAVNRKLILVSDLTINYDSGAFINLFAEDVRIAGISNIPANSTNLTIMGSTKIATGDQFYIQQDPTLLLSGTSFTVTNVISTVQVGNLYQSTFTINQGTPRTLAINDTVYLQAFPSYYSPIVNIPTQRRRPISIGPFVLDYLSGRFDDGDTIQEALDFQIFDFASAPIIPTVDGASLTHAYKNFPVLNMPIDSSSFLFWDVVRGKINYQPDNFILECDDRGRASIATELFPFWTGPAKWTVPAQGITAASGVVRYRFYPNPEKVAGAVSLFAPSTLTFELLAGEEPSNKLEIIFTSTANASTKWGTWSPEKEAKTIQYTLTGRVLGNYIWQASSLMLKPYFNSIGDIEGILDFDNFNNGAVAF